MFTIPFPNVAALSGILSGVLSYNPSSTDTTNALYSWPSTFVKVPTGVKSTPPFLKAYTYGLSSVGLVIVQNLFSNRSLFVSCLNRSLFYEQNIRSMSF